MQIWDFSFIAPDIHKIIPGIPNTEVPHSHTDKWMLYPSDYAPMVFDWFKKTIKHKPGTYTVSGRVTDEKEILYKE